MNEGKKLLYSIIDSKLDKLSSLDTSILFTDGINLKELADLLDYDDLNFYIVTDDIISRVIEENKIKNVEKFKKNITSARDLLIGKRDYNLKINLNQDHTNALKTFKKNLAKIIDNINDEIITKDEKIKKIEELKKDIDSNFLLNNFELIESITRDYDALNYDKNMIVIMKYINDFNLNLIKIPKKNPPKFDIQMIKRPKLDAKIKDILNKLDIDLNDMPNYLLSELKNCNVSEFVDTYNTLKKNKAENGGILHFIDKMNKLYLLVTLLFATSKSIKDIISTVADENGILDISLLKVIINYVPGSILVKNNAYFTALHDNYMRNYQMLKRLDVNISILIKRCPLFMMIKNETLEYTLDFFHQNGANKKNIINRCYKTLAVDPSLLIDNLDIMKKHNINIEEFFSNSNTNYTLLKVPGLDKKLNYLKRTTKVDLSDIETLNKIIIAKVYRESNEGYVSWGEL